MVVDVALYTFVHQPRRLKLPAQPVPRSASIEDLTRCLFDERLNEYAFRQIAQSSYYPGARILLDLVRTQGLRLALGCSYSFIDQARRWEPALLDLLRELASEDGVEIVGADPFHSLHCLIDLPAFVQRMVWMADEIEQLLGKRPCVADTTDMCMSASIYSALETAGFRGAFMDGDARLLQWRSSNYLYHHRDQQTTPVLLPASRQRRNTRSGSAGRISMRLAAADEPGYDENLYLLACHQDLSSAVDRHFSDLARSDSPLYADAYARRIAQTEGDFTFLRWDLASLGGSHRAESGIFDFLRALPGELARENIATRTPSEIIERSASERAYYLPLPVHPPAWGATLGLESTATYETRGELFQLLRDTYNLARLTEQPELLDLALWLAQADNFSLLQEGSRPALDYPWWQPGPVDYLREQKQVCLNMLGALEPYLPTRLQRAARAPRRKPAAVAAS